MNTQESVGAWTMGLGKLLLVAMFVICVIDISGIQERGGLMLSLTGYLVGIFTGVAMQFVGAAIPNMKFAPAE